MNHVSFHVSTGQARVLSWQRTEDYPLPGIEEGNYTGAHDCMSQQNSSHCLFISSFKVHLCFFFQLPIWLLILRVSMVEGSLKAHSKTYSGVHGTLNSRDAYYR